MILESTRSKDLFYVDWWLMNHCNYNCSYCADLIKNGSIDLPNITDCLDFVDKVSDHCRYFKRTADFNLTGGEITQWPFLVDLLDRIRIYNFRSSIRSNASCSIDFWKDIINSVTSVRLEFHPEFQNLSHFVMIVAATMKKSIDCSILVNMIPERWEELEQMIEKLSVLYPQLPISKKMLFSDPAVNTVPLPYTEPQLQDFENQNGDLIFYERGKPIKTNFQSLILHNKNRFAGNQCSSGIEQIIVDAWGRVYRGHCRQGGAIGRIGKTLTLPTESVTCNKPSCSNGFDIHSTKF